MKIMEMRSINSDMTEAEIGELRKSLMSSKIVLERVLEQGARLGRDARNTK